VIIPQSQPVCVRVRVRVCVCVRVRERDKKTEAVSLHAVHLSHTQLIMRSLTHTQLFVI